MGNRTAEAGGRRLLVSKMSKSCKALQFNRNIASRSTLIGKAIMSTNHYQIRITLIISTRIQWQLSANSYIVLYYSYITALQLLWYTTVTLLHYSYFDKLQLRVLQLLLNMESFHCLKFKYSL